MASSSGERSGQGWRRFDLYLICPELVLNAAEASQRRRKPVNPSKSHDLKRAPDRAMNATHAKNAIIPATLKTLPYGNPLTV